VKSRHGRRRFLAGIGATGLAVATATFIRPTAAFAANYGCCNLAHPPGDPNFVSYSYCQAHAAYIWTCRNPSIPVLCKCCETAGNAKSSASCQRP
jgi:hypothetical protein